MPGSVAAHLPRVLRHGALSGLEKRRAAATLLQPQAAADGLDDRPGGGPRDLRRQIFPPPAPPVPSPVPRAWTGKRL
jgi:hypothetical protein